MRRKAPLARFRHILRAGLSYKLRLLRPLCLPYQFAIEATNLCNFRCRYCPQSNDEHRAAREPGQLSLESYRLFLERVLATRTANRMLSICLDGEPLLNDHFLDFIALANQSGFYPRFLTNGKLLTTVLADELAKAGGFVVAVDFCAEPQVFETTRGRQGDFAPILGNLRHLTTIARQRSDVEVEIADISPFVGRDSATSLSLLRSLFPDDLPSNVRFKSRKFHSFCGHLPFGQTNRRRYRLCPYPWTTFTAAWNGDVVACCRDTRGRTVLGNAFAQSVQHIWYAQAYQDLRRHLARREPEKVAACSLCDLPWRWDDDRWRPRYILTQLLGR